MPTPPPALSRPPQFDPAYWGKVPREKVKVKLVRITKVDDDFTEFVFDDGNAFQRRVEQLDPDVMAKLHVNVTVYVETINAELVTGMWIPETGWLFRMTSEDLADYAEALMTRAHVVRENAKAELRAYIALALQEGIKEQVDIEAPDEEGAVALSGPISLDTLAGFVMNAMELARSAGAAPTRES